MSTIRCVYQSLPPFPATDQHPDAVRYVIASAMAPIGVYWVDAIGGEPTVVEVEAIVKPAARAALAARTRLSGDVAFYVSSTGSDTTGDGSSALPWATIGKVYAHAQKNLDLAGFAVNCYLQDAYTTGDILVGPLAGAKGPHSFVIRGTADDRSRMFSGYVYAQNGAQCRLRYLQAQPSFGSCVVVTDGVVEFGDININTFGNGPMFNAAGPRAKVRQVGPCTLVGVASCRHVFIAEMGAHIELPESFDIAGAPAWTSAFVQADLGGRIDGTGFSCGAGAATGSRYTAASLGIVFTGAAAGSSDPNFYPGSLPGSSAGGFYQ